MILPERKIVLVGGGALLLTAAAIALSRRVGASTASSARFGDLVLSRAESDLGVVESSPNSGPRVDAMLRNVGVNFPANWCAAAVATWIKEAAAALRVPPPIAGSASVLATVTQFQDPQNARVGWYDAATLRATPVLVEPGMIVAWSRGGVGSGLGHIGVMKSGAPGFADISGNAGANADRVSLGGPVDLASSALLGMGYFKDRAIVGVGYLNDPPGAALFPTG